MIVMWEKMKSNSFLIKYKNLSITFKATIWYAICNMLQKLAAFLIIPFLTRMLTIEDYGLYTVFLSWLEIFEIIATMRIYSNGYVAGLVKNSDDQQRYTCSIQFICVVVISIFFAVFYVLSPLISEKIEIEPPYIFLMFLSYYATASIGIWSARQRVNNRYKMMVLVTLVYSVLAPICSIAAAAVSSQKLQAAIGVRVLVQFIVALPFFVSNSLGKHKTIVWKYCKEALKYNIPLIPYYLSMVILNSSDRIMIQRIVGESEAAVYGVAYSLSMAVFVFSGALNLSLQPWIFGQLKKKSDTDSSLTINIATGFVTLMNFFLLVTAPELIVIVASQKYYEAVWTMPPIIISLLVMFIYQQFLNVHFYFGKNKVIFAASIIAGGMNLILNFIFINLFGYIAAGYTTLASYSIIAFLYYITMKRTCESTGVDYTKYFNMRYIAGDVVGFIVTAFIVMLLYPYPFIRYGIVFVIMIICFIKRKTVIEFCRKSGLMKRGL